MEFCAGVDDKLALFEELDQPRDGVVVRSAGVGNVERDFCCVGTEGAV